MSLERFERACGLTAAVAVRENPEPDEGEFLGSLLAVLEEARELYRQGNIEHANRSLGYVQGLLAAFDHLSNEEMRRIDAPEADR